jgi:hypothetical protein
MTWRIATWASQPSGIETTAGDLEVTDPAGVAQYARWGALLADAAALNDELAPVIPAVA